MTPPSENIPPRPEGIAGTVWDLTFGAGQKATKIIDAKAAFEEIKGTVSKEAVYLLQFMDDINKLSGIMEKVNANLELLNEHIETLLPKTED